MMTIVPTNPNNQSRQFSKLLRFLLILPIAGLSLLPMGCSETQSESQPSSDISDVFPDTPEAPPPVAQPTPQINSQPPCSDIMCSIDQQIADGQRFVNENNQKIQALQSACQNGDAAACNQLNPQPAQQQGGGSSPIWDNTVRNSMNQYKGQYERLQRRKWGLD